MRRHYYQPANLPTYLLTYLTTYLPTYLTPLEPPDNHQITARNRRIFTFDIQRATLETCSQLFPQLFLNFMTINLCYLTINCDTGQHSQFLRCLVYYPSSGPVGLASANLSGVVLRREQAVESLFAFEDRKPGRNGLGQARVHLRFVVFAL